MSFHAHLEIAPVSFMPPDVGACRVAICALLDADGIHHDVFDDLALAFREGRAAVSVDAVYLLLLLDRVAPLLAAVGGAEADFDARGLGESVRSTWVAEYRGGERVFSAGPWDA